jgi:hypothetical protein
MWKEKVMPSIMYYPSVQLKNVGRYSRFYGRDPKTGPLQHEDCKPSVIPIPRVFNDYFSAPNVI